METRTIIIVACITLALFVQGSYGTKCYQCTDCKDPFNKDQSGVTTTDCPTGACMKSKGKFLGVETVQRDCAPSKGMDTKCQKQSVAGVSASVCICSGDLCNGSTVSRISVAGILSIIAGVFVYKNIV